MSEEKHDEPISDPEVGTKAVDRPKSVSASLRTNLQSGFQSAVRNLESGINDARRNLKEGLQSARANLQSGVDDARRNIASGLESARVSLDSGIESARNGVNSALLNARDIVSQTPAEAVTRPAEYPEEQIVLQPAVTPHHTTDDETEYTLEEMTLRLERQIKERGLLTQRPGVEVPQETGIVY